MWEKFQNIFWNEDFWLPQNVSWSDFENHDNGKYIPQLSDLLLAVVIGPGLFFARLIFERYLVKPVASVYIKDTHQRKADKNETLENLFKKNRNPSDKIVQGISKQTDLQVRYIERWFRIRRNQERGSVVKKFTEGSFRLTVYSFLLIYGIFTLWDKCWFIDKSKFFTGYPHHHVSNDLYWYYNIELAFYFSLLISQFTDVKRKDFTMMFIHHLLTIYFLSYSWLTNHVRIGSVVLIMHDICDPILELTKLIVYLKFEMLSNIMFVVFMLSWLITRLIIFPYTCVWPAIFEAPKAYGVYPFYVIHNTLFVSLFLLHLLWTKFIIQAAMKSIKAGGKIEKDERSEEEESISDEGEGDKIIANGKISQNGSNSLN